MTGDVFGVFDLWKKQAALASGMAALGPAVGFVVATRMTRMALEGGRPSANGMREAERMVSEKMAALVEGGLAVGEVLSGLARAVGPVAAAGLMVAAGEAALKPAARRLNANAKRLSRR